MATTERQQIFLRQGAFGVVNISYDVIDMNRSSNVANKPPSGIKRFSHGGLTTNAVHLHQYAGVAQLVELLFCK